MNGFDFPELSGFGVLSTPLSSTNVIVTDALVESIVLKSLDENGERLFKDVDRIELMNQADPNVIIKVASILNNANMESIGDIEKNL